MDNSKIINLSEVTPRVNISNYFYLKKGVDHWGPRSLHDYEIILILKGNFRYEEEGKKNLVLEDGNILIIPPFVNHRLCLYNNDKVSPGIACLHNDPVPPLAHLSGFTNFNPAFQRKTALSKLDFIEARRIFKKCNTLYLGLHPYRESLMSSLCRQIWLMAGAYWFGEKQDAAGRTRTEAMRRYILQNLHKPLSRQTLAREFSLTPEHVNALFKRELAISPTALINKEKVMRGYIMLHNEGLTVKETAYRCGFKDEYYFSRVFRKILGFSPGAVKGEGRGIAILQDPPEAHRPGE